MSTRSVSNRPLATACATAMVASALILSVTACSKDKKYEPRPAFSGAKASLPPVPNLANKPVAAGDVYNVWGAGLTLRNRLTTDKVKGSKIKVSGVIGAVNYDKAPACAVHKRGKEDGPDCKSPIPTFWLCEAAGDKVEDCIQVMGWASNFATIFDAVNAYKKDGKDSKAEIRDTFAGDKLVPKPLPNVGAEVTVTGLYATSYKGVTSMAADPTMGILTYESMEFKKQPNEPASLPGMDKDKPGAPAAPAAPAAPKK